MLFVALPIAYNALMFYYLPGNALLETWRESFLFDVLTVISAAPWSQKEIRKTVCAHAAPRRANNDRVLRLASFSYLFLRNGTIKTLGVLKVHLLDPRPENGRKSGLKVQQMYPRPCGGMPDQVGHDVE